MKFTFIVSDESVNNYGFRILTDGIDTTQFKKNPVGYYMHQRRTSTNFDAAGDEVICRWENLQKMGNGIMLADAVFDEDDAKAMKIAKKVEKNFIRMASIGVNPMELSEDKQFILPGQTRPTVTKSSLMEISIVDRGGNNNALVKLYDGEQQDYELPKLKSMDLEKELRKELNLSDEASVKDAVVKLSANAVDYKAKYDALVQLNADARKAEAVKLVDAAIEAKVLKAERKEAFIALFEADAKNAKGILEDLMGTVKEKPSAQLGDFLEGIETGAGKEKGTTKDYAWYEMNDPEALLEMKSSDPTKFEKLFNESL